METNKNTEINNYITDLTIIDGNFISRLRKDAGMTQVQFSNIFGVAHTTIMGWELNKSKPNSQQMITLYQLRKRIDYLKLSRPEVDVFDYLNCIMVRGMIGLMQWIFDKSNRI